MSNVAVAWSNIALNATLASSSAASSMPVSLLQQEDVSRHFRSAAGTTVDIDLTFATTQSADTFAILGTNLSSAGTVRIKLSNVSLGGTDIWDSTTLASNLVDSLFTTSPRLRGEDAVVLSASVRSGWKYCRITLTDSSPSYIEAGFLFISTRSQFTYNMDWGFSRQIIDPSTKKMTNGGQTKVIRKDKYRQWDFTIGSLTQTQRDSISIPLDLANGSSLPLLFIADPASSTLGRDSIFGFVDSTSPMPVLQQFGPDNNPMYSRQYKITERL